MYCSRCGMSLIEGAVACTACGQAAPAVAMQTAGVPMYAPPAGAPMVSHSWVPAPQFPYAGFWLRVVAYLVDGTLIGIVFVIALIAAVIVTGAAAGLQNIERNPDAAVAAVGVFGILLFVALGLGAIIGVWLYYAMCESSTWQGTIGKKILGLYVTDMKGARVSFGRASGRFFSRIITGLIPLGIGWILAGVTEKKQALHDMIAACMVLRRD